MIANIIGFIIGIIIAIPGTIFLTRKYLRPRHEMLYFAISLIPIALFYIGFAYYYGELAALDAEIIGVIVFSVLALLAIQLHSSILIYAYLVHAGWDVLHEIYVSSVAGVIPWSQVPMGYAAFCLAYDVIIALYVWKRCSIWQSDKASVE
ncbi:MAG: hypothetical protein V3T17_10345 [Pseudomonadales bacterium]